MSDFLVNLARRSAGLAPIVRPRPAPAPVAIDMPSATQAESVAPHDAAPAPIVVVMPSAAPAAPAVDAHPVAALAIAPMLGSVAQRTAAASFAAPVTPSAPLGRAADAQRVAPRAPIALEPVARERAVAHATAPLAPELPAAPRRSERSADAIVPAIMPAAIARIERVIEPAATDAPAPVVVTTRPAESAAPATLEAWTEPAPERTVHVRIGAIEIYGADAGGSARPPAATAPAAVATPASPVSPAGGFDDYAALRSYAPWAW